MPYQELTVHTHSRIELVDITAQIQRFIRDHKVESGLLFLFVPHTTAAITVNESADPSVQRDILAEINRLIPLAGPYQHAEGNSAAHIKSTMIGPSQTFIIEGGQLALGTWQGLFFCEFDGPRTRKVWIKILPD
jgi:secondary thiamine-phosphate synthase enzyme